jgi:hypothetical protein
MRLKTLNSSRYLDICYSFFFIFSSARIILAYFVIFRIKLYLKAHILITFTLIVYLLDTESGEISRHVKLGKLQNFTTLKNRGVASLGTSRILSIRAGWHGKWRTLPTFLELMMDTLPWLLFDNSCHTCIYI